MQLKEKSRADEESASVSQKKNKGKSKEAGKTQNDASGSSTTRRVRGPDHLDTVAVNSDPPLRKPTGAQVIDSVIIDEDVLKNVTKSSPEKIDLTNSDDSPEKIDLTNSDDSIQEEDAVIATPSRGYRLEERSVEQLYNDILAVTICTGSDENFTLNRGLMEYIKSMQHFYGDVIKDEAVRLNFFKKVFEGILFFKKFLTVRATSAPFEL